MDEYIIENTEGGQFAYTLQKTGISIKRYRGTGTRAAIPAQIEGKPVISIEKKAFLSCKTIQEIVLPNTIEEIGDWAFAHAEQLRSITVPHCHLYHGKELFLGCKRLKEIILDGTEEEKAIQTENGLGRMLAMAVTVLHDYFLFSPKEVGTQAWIGRWDEKLLDLIALDDLDGFEELWTCGEEDYEGKDYDIKSYPVEKRKMKLRIVYFRLLHPYRISGQTSNTLKKYLAMHTKGTQTPEAWDIIIEEHKEELEYYKTFADAGGVTLGNFDLLLADTAKASAEIKAFLLRYKEEHFGQKDAFADFELDW